jgi:hypothetical protein
MSYKVSVEETAQIVAMFLRGRSVSDIALKMFGNRFVTTQNGIWNDPTVWKKLKKNVARAFIYTVLRKELRKGQKAQKELKKLKPPTAAEVNKQYYKWLRDKRNAEKTKE